MKTLYVSDLDGTLLNDEAGLSNTTKAVLNGLIMRGMPFTYATARSWSSAHKVTAGIPLALPVITYNGTFIVDPSTGAPIDACVFTAAQRDLMIDTLIPRGFFPLIYTLINGAEKVLWVKGKETNGILDYIQCRTGDKRLHGVDTADELKVGDMFYVTLIGSLGMLAPLAGLFQDKTQCAYNFQADTYNKNEYWFEIYPTTASKAEGVKKLRKLLGMERVVCFGDNLNDVPMFAESDACYAVANAQDALKNIATGVIRSNNDDGVAKWLVGNYEGLHV